MRHQVCLGRPQLWTSSGSEADKKCPPSLAFASLPPPPPLSSLAYWPALVVRGGALCADLVPPVNFRRKPARVTQGADTAAPPATSPDSQAPRSARSTLSYPSLPICTSGPPVLFLVPASLSRFRRLRSSSPLPSSSLLSSPSLLLSPSLPVSPPSSALASLPLSNSSHST